jgi:hypothetical protein
MKFSGSIAPHFWCLWCNILWVEEYGYLLQCTQAHHIRDAEPARKTA